jgi:foldase protein PrsA
VTNAKTLWTLIGALVVLLLVVSWSWYRSSAAFHPAAVVGERTISEADWVAMLKQKYGQQVLEDMINREVVFQEAKRLGVTVDPKRVEDELAQIRESYGSRTDAEFREALAKQAGTTLDALRQEIAYQLLLQELAIKDIAISDEELLAFYSSHPERYARPMQVRLLQIVVASRGEAQQVLNELNGGANFATLAKERSIDSLTAANGGDAGWVTLNDSRLPEAAKEVIASLGIQVNSEPVEIDGTFAIYRIVDRREAEQVTFEQAKDEIRREMALAQVESLDVVLERLRKAVGVQVSGQMPH